MHCSGLESKGKGVRREAFKKNTAIRQKRYTTITVAEYHYPCPEGQASLFPKITFH
jgi:hypothetical protein